MTTPGGHYPDDAIKDDDLSDLNGLDQDEWRAELNDRVIGDEVAPQHGFNLFRSLLCDGIGEKPFSQVADLEDGQNQIADRVELLEDVSGYGTAVMGKNWKLPLDTWVDVPFTTQVGPMKHVDVESSGDRNGVLVLKRGGLWRVDLIMNGRGVYREFVTTLGTDPVTGWPTTVSWTNYYGIRLLYRILIKHEENTYSTAEFIEPGPPLAAEGFSDGYYGHDGNRNLVDIQRSASFSCTFVVDAGIAENTAAKVRVQAKTIPGSGSGVGITLASGSEASIYGGTKLSLLTATRWSRETDNPGHDETAPDGGTL